MNSFLKRLKSTLGSRGSSWAAVTCLTVAAVVLLNVLLYTLTATFGLYAYKSDEDDMSLSGATDGLYKTLPTDRGVTVTFCMAREDLEKHTTGAAVLDTALRFAERYSFIKLRFVNLLTQVDQDGERVDLERYTTDMRGETTRVLASSVIFESGANYRVITDSQSAYGFAGFYVFNSSGKANAYCGEEIMGAMVAWVLNDEHKTAYLTQNHGETADVAMSNLLVCTGYYVDVVNLRKQEVPEDAGLVVISSPVYDFEKGAEGSSVRAEIERLTTYMDKGGSIYVAIDPVAPRLPVLEEFLGKYGIAITGNDTEDGYVRHMIRDRTDSVSVSGMSFVATHAEGTLSEKIAAVTEKHGSGRVYLKNVGRLELSGAAKPLLVSSPSSVALAGKDEVDSEGGYTVAAYSESVAKDGRAGRIFVIPGVFISVSEIMITEGYSNKDFLATVLDEVLGAAFSLPGVKNVLMYDDTSLHGFTMKNAYLFSAVIAALPIAAAVTAAIIVRRRKNR